MARYLLLAAIVLVAACNGINTGPSPGKGSDTWAAGSLGLTRPSSADAAFELAVSDRRASVKILDANYRVVRILKKGLESPDGLWYDPQGDLYVADRHLNAVLEYAPGAKTPTFTYSPVDYPVDVTTDAQGNVYVASYEGDSITEFGNRSDTIITQCNPDSFPVDGVAVDASGDVFVSLVTATSGTGGALFESVGV